MGADTADIGPPCEWGGGMIIYTYKKYALLTETIYL